MAGLLHHFPWRAIPAEFGVSGFVCRYERHFIYWKLLEDGAIGIVTILHEKMHQIERFMDDFRWSIGYLAIRFIKSQKGGIMNRYFRAMILASLCIPIAGNAEITSNQFKTVQLSKVIINPDIPKENQHIKVGTICLFGGQPINFGSNERTLGLERFERLFSSAMSDHGFKIVAKYSDMFEGESSSPRADILIGATFHPQSVDLCDSVNGQKGTVVISVDWQIYDRSKQQVVETSTTKGSGQLPKFQQDGLMKMIDQAFSFAVTALADQGVLQKYLGNPAP